MSAPPVEDVLGDVVVELERVFAGLSALGAALVALAATREPLRREHVETLQPAIFELLAEHPDLVAGAGVVTAPELLEDAPRWLEWWWSSDRGAPEPLRVNLDPSAPDFYDYTTTEWYSAPADRVAGPYVDYACTNEYALTLSSPVRLGGRRLGVAAADVLVASLERRVLPALVALGRPTALVNAEGRVIAANAPELLPGMRVELPAPSRGSWQLVQPRVS
jgi:hypothetical protein